MIEFDFGAAIFDLDGTLLDTMGYWRFTTLEYLLAHGLPVRDGDLLAMRDTSSRKLLYDIAEREKFTLPDKQTLVSELEDFMLRHYLYDSRPKDECVEAFLKWLKANGKRACVATASRKVYVENGLKKNGLIAYFDFVTDGYELPVTKSDPRYFDLVAEKFGTTAERCVVFEDALYSIRSAKQAGCRVVAIEDDSQRLDREEIRAASDIYITSYRELLSR